MEFATQYLLESPCSMKKLPIPKHYLKTQYKPTTRASTTLGRHVTESHTAQKPLQ